MEKIKKKLLIGLLVAVLITPIGIFLPRWFKTGDAWGEWSTETIREKTGHVPAGMQKDADIWKAPMPDYSLGNENSSLARKSVQYIISGIVGLAIISLFSFGLSKLVKKE
jgi:uncharacterized membrane protein